MGCVIEELCKGAEWSEKDLKKEAAERNRIDQLYEYLKNNISSNQLNTLKRLMKSEYDLRQTENIRFFINGFRLGMSLKSEN